MDNTEFDYTKQYSDEEINELAEWLNGLTFKQVYFLKESYQAMVEQHAKECGQAYEH